MYLGTVFEDVNAAGRSNPLGVLVSQGQDANTYDPAGVLQLGTTYYWRIDEVNAPPSSTIYKGDVWSFTTEPVGVPIGNVVATASSLQTGMGPENTVNGSGLDPSDAHSTDGKQMWLSAGALPNWIQFEFDKAYKLHELWVWNSNQTVEGIIGFGAKDVAIEYSADGTTWTPLTGVPVFTRASGSPAYVHDTVVEFRRRVRKVRQADHQQHVGRVGLQRLERGPVLLHPRPGETAATSRWRDRSGAGGRSELATGTRGRLPQGVFQ